MSKCWAFLWLFTINVVNATFSTGFQEFLTLTYGAEISANLTRLDQGVNGSFGGSYASQPIRVYRTPLVLTHGMNNNAGSLDQMRKFYTTRGYGENELYSTTYGPNGTIIGAGDSLNCSWIKQVRQLVIAVRAYTQQPIDVVGYSLGVPVLRKALLGGKCVDTGEDLGSSLTSSIRTFLSVAGANYGALECNEFPTAEACNNITGCIIGSEYLKDINSKPGYESNEIFVIRSTTDEVVGYNVSNVLTSSHPGALINVTITNFTHVDTCFNTLNIQYSLISTGYVSQFTIDKDTTAESEITGLKCTGNATGNSPISSSYGNRNDNEGSEKGQLLAHNKTYVFPNGYPYWSHGSNKGKFFG